MLSLFSIQLFTASTGAHQLHFFVLLTMTNRQAGSAQAHQEVKLTTVLLLKLSQFNI